MDVLDERAINVFTDGSSYQGPRRGGMGIIIVTVGADGHPVVEDVPTLGVRGATNQQMELQACIEALKHLAGRYSQVRPSDFTRVVIHTDSMYVVEGYRSALFRWQSTGWMTREGNPVANAEQWKELLRAAHKVGRSVEFRWVKGHKSSNLNKAADRAAKRSAKGALNRPLSVMNVRRKKTSRSVDRGSVVLDGQRLTIRIVTDEYLRTQRCYKYKYEVMSKASPFYTFVDLAYSDVLLSAGHTYFVLMGKDSRRPRIEKMYREVPSRA